MLTLKETKEERLAYHKWWAHDDIRDFGEGYERVNFTLVRTLAAVAVASVACVRAGVDSRPACMRFAHKAQHLGARPSGHIGCDSGWHRCARCDMQALSREPCLTGVGGAIRLDLQSVL